MIASLAFGLAAVLGPDCEASRVSSARPALEGVTQVEPVDPSLQRKAFDALAAANFQTLDRSTAEALSARDLPEGRYYYVVRAGVVGEAPTAPGPSGIVLEAMVDVDHIAHVGSFRLSRSRETADMAVVLITDVPVDGVVAACGAAE
jgi:hypothetical protein